MVMRKKIRVLIVDDSAVVRATMTEILSSDPGIEVMSTAQDPYEAVKKMKTCLPDVITLDVEMPRMDGITFLHKIMSQHPIPVIICSSLTDKGSETALRAMEYGAVEIIEKPRLGTKQFLREAKILICDKVKAAALAKLKTVSTRMKVEPKLSADAMLAPPPIISRAMAKTTESIVAVGASTGGTEALRIFLEDLPKDAPGIVIVQHMPENFTTAFSSRLNSLCHVEVKEAVNGDSVLRGRALIAPGNRHMLLKRSGAKYYVEVKEGPLVNRHRPSVDILFRSTARYAGSNAIGVIMTGMGDDGAKGLLEMKQSGSPTIAQDEATSVVFGMPHEAIELGAADNVMPLQRIASAVMRLCTD